MRCWCVIFSTASSWRLICQGSRFIDVGTGPGLPGIPLAIVCPESHFTLLDSLGKRVRFLRQVQHELKLDNVTPVQSRVEAFPAEPPFDGVDKPRFSHRLMIW
ncbi:rRNA small subunit methyltransferase [Klebsiella pneumoniae]|uniref:rRNA small subunit methyltransferase n=1 Tax=Klebsiella pneumoniae TaxID=573 RepID=A0A447RUB5_KLEPN|nr:rRNA small subunit methyltransferase [Klebsiella pneumoniae]